MNQLKPLSCAIDGLFICNPFPGEVKCLDLLIKNWFWIIAHSLMPETVSYFIFFKPLDFLGWLHCQICERERERVEIDLLVIIYLHCIGLLFSELHYLQLQPVKISCTHLT